MKSTPKFVSYTFKFLVFQQFYGGSINSSIMLFVPVQFINRHAVVQLLSCVQLFATPWTAECQASLSFTISQSLLKFMSTESVIHPIISSSVIPFSSCPQSFPHQGLPMSQLFTSGGQSIGVSALASVLPMNIQNWFPLGWLVGSPCSSRDSQESTPAPQFKSINSLALSFLYGPALTSIHDYWKNHSFN